VFSELHEVFKSLKAQNALLLQKYDIFEEGDEKLNAILKNAKLEEENLTKHKITIYSLVGRLNESEDLRIRMEDKMHEQHEKFQ